MIDSIDDIIKDWLEAKGWLQIEQYGDTFIAHSHTHKITIRKCNYGVYICMSSYNTIDDLIAEIDKTMPY